MTFLPDSKGLADVLASDETLEGLAELAEEAAENARNLAPVDEGDYKDSIKVVTVGAIVYLMATDWKSKLIEFGSANNPVFAPLRRGIEAAGLEQETTPK